MAIYAIGDLQGCHTELTQLLRQIKFKPDRDRIWFCGDLVNRGPESLLALRHVRDMADNAVTVLGNHDLHLLAQAFMENPPGKKDTLQQILNAPDRDQLLEWLRQQPLVHHDKETGFTLVHAGIHPHWSIKQALGLSAEIQQVLQGDKHVDYYNHMYGDKPAIWSDSLKGWKRYRFITNTFTRMRYCNADGTLNLGAKYAPGSQAKGLFPWYETPARKTEKNRIVFGHWSTLPQAGKHAVNNAYALDSGCVWGGSLSALRLDKEPYQFYQLGCSQKQKPGLKKTASKKHPDSSNAIRQDRL